MRRFVGGITRRFVSTNSQSENLFVLSQSVARILEIHAGSTELRNLNYAVGSIVQLYSKQIVDRMSLTETRCTDLVNKVYEKIEKMGPEDVVSFFEWYSKSRFLKLGWRSITPSERDALIAKLELHCKSNAYSISQLMSLSSACSSLHFGFRTISVAMEQQLLNPEVDIHLSDLKKLMEILSKSQNIGPKMLTYVVARLRKVDFSFVDPKSIVSLYKSMCSAELFLHSASFSEFVAILLQKMAEKLPTFPEIDLMDLLDVHKNLTYPRPSVFQMLIFEISHRFEKAEILSKTFIFQVIRVFVHMRESGMGEIPNTTVYKLMIEASKHVPSQWVNVYEFEAVVRGLYSLSDLYPVELIAAVKKKILSYPSENLAIVSCIRLLEKAKEDYTPFWKFIVSLIADLSSYSVAERLTILNSIHLSKRVEPFEELEKILVASIKTIVDEKSIDGTLNIFHKVISNPNKHILHSLDFIRQSSLEQMNYQWKANSNNYWKLFLSFYAYEGNRDLWIKVISMQTTIDEEDYSHAVNILATEGGYIEPAMLVLDLHPKLLTPEVLISMQRLITQNSNHSVVSKYFKLIDSLNVAKMSKSNLTKTVDMMIRLITENNVSCNIDNFLSGLEVVRNSLTSPEDAPLQGRILNLLIQCNKLSTEETLQYVRTSILSGTMMKASLNAAKKIWPEIKSNNLVPDIINVLNEKKSSNIAQIIKSRMKFIGEIEDEIEWKFIADTMAKKIRTTNPHLMTLLVDILDVLPSHYLSFNPNFIKFLHGITLEKFSHQDCAISPKNLIRYLRQLIDQNIGNSTYPELIGTIKSRASELSPRDKTEFLSSLCKFGDAYEEPIARLLVDITRNVKEYIPFTGSILSALSDGRLQSEERSAKVAEALIFSKEQRFDFAPDDIAQVLMFALQIGMGDNSLTRKLLSMPPPLGPNQFNLKRYLLHLHYKNTENAHFSLETELQFMKKEIANRAWKYFHTLKLTPEEKETLIGSKTAFNEQIFVNDCYVPLVLSKSKKMLWKVPVIAKIQNKNELLGDYQFYLQLAKKMTDFEVEIEYPKEESNRRFNY